MRLRGDRCSSQCCTRRPEQTLALFAKVVSAGHHTSSRVSVRGVVADVTVARMEAPSLACQERKGLVRNARHLSPLPQSLSPQFPSRSRHLGYPSHPSSSRSVECKLPDHHAVHHWTGVSQESSCAWPAVNKPSASEHLATTALRYPPQCRQCFQPT